MNNLNYDYSVQHARLRLSQLGVDINTPDYFKIPLENTDLQQIEQEIPKKSKVVVKHTVIIDSRQRDYSIYPNSNNYLVELFEAHRNVERIELIAAMIPKTEYNVNSENNLLLVTVGMVTKELFLTEGQYLIGSNTYGVSDYISNGNNTDLWGLIGEIKRVLNNGFNTSNFDVFLVTAPSPNDPTYQSTGTGRNASILNRMAITSDDPFIIDFTNTNYTNGSPFRLMGFQKQIISSGSNYIYGSSDSGLCTVADLEVNNPYAITTNSILSKYDYDMYDDPNYIIMNLEFGNKSASRVESIDIATNNKFAVIIYDANEPDNIQTYNSSTTASGNDVMIKIDRRPGRLKALKGSDFDKKILMFTPPITLDNFKISYYKYDNTLYEFHNREHLLTFELDIADYDPTYRY
jgi:hypothetical protein